VRLVRLAALALALSGCGYSTHSLIGDDYRTIHVEILGNRTFRRDLEFELTRDIQSEILSRTPLRIVDRSRADVRLEGDIIDFQENVISTDEHDRIFESSVRVTVAFRLVDQRSGTEMKRFTLYDSSPFLAQQGQTEKTAAQETFADLAEHVVYQLERSF
jgi:lipopolysaccharide assembly LptE-like protein